MDIINSVNAEDSTVFIVTHDAKVATRASRVIYLMVGNIHKELAPRKYEMDENKRSYCEIRLFECLEKQGF
ncbi:MAG: transporter ATP-binding protein [Anaerocolumna sp.]|jgi:putative ABC transport system ATP-binding protein|nr:transporter ATP-binding protein [Anaerocolumna sp.]